MSMRLEALNRQHGEIKAGIDAIEAAAVAAGGDLTDAQQSDLDKLYARAETLAPEIEAEGKKVGSINAAAEVLKRHMPSSSARPAPQPAVGTPFPEVSTVGEYLSVLFRAMKSEDAGDRAEAGEILKRALAQQTTGTNPLIVPDAIVTGDLIKFADDSRPVFSSFSPRPMPAHGKTFVRPLLTQRVNVAEQAAELDEVVSRQMTLSGSNVSKRTFAGGLKLSEQDIDWTDPAILQLVINDFAGVYAQVTEAAACTFLLGSMGYTSAWTATNPGTLVSSITTGIGAVYPRAKAMPDTLWLDLASALALAGTTNSNTDISALMLIKQAIKETGMVDNFDIVVGPMLPANTRILGRRGLVEAYEQRKGLISAVDVPHLGLDVAYRGYVAFFARAEGFVKLV